MLKLTSIRQSSARRGVSYLETGLIVLIFVFLAGTTTGALFGQTRLDKKRARKAAAGRIPPAEGLSHCEGDRCEYRFTWGYDTYTYECGTSLQSRTVYRPNVNKPEGLDSGERVELMTLEGRAELGWTYDRKRKEDLEDKKKDAQEAPDYVPSTVLYTQPDYCSAEEGRFDVVALAGSFYLRYESYSPMIEHDACRITVARNGSSRTYTCEKELGQNAWRAEIPAPELIDLLGRFEKKGALERFLSDTPSVSVSVHGQRANVYFDGPHYRYQVEDFIARHRQ